MKPLHPRAIIRNALYARLKTALADGTFLTAAADRVFKSRMATIDVEDDEELPAIMIYARDEARDPKLDYGIDADDSLVSPELKIVIEGIVRGGATVDDKLDALALEIESALEDWEIPGFEGATMRLGDTDIDVIAEGTRKPVGAIGLVWHVKYSRPWRDRPPGTRPNTVNVAVGGVRPERIITNDRGLGNEPRPVKPPTTVANQAFLDGLPAFLLPITND